ncbi:hypothetical protein CQ010_01365 [Arthrobacter sp. MYb211]|uniref:hypothetical protein n=1 Tax=unclassified Arthrobacter TaxID=235627 RepID=UPI000CFCB837|nr:MULTISPECIES: hypothetical protein [unclassified Arthrobacter]PRA13323.1 hypothetical protein CQ015_03620 [Arthrobacter sp. MYb221]PRC10520.1 hypothetical protein CQ010_01365 [Arthrobacter sp. MYb211]
MAPPTIDDWADIQMDSPTYRPLFTFRDLTNRRTLVTWQTHDTQGHITGAGHAVFESITHAREYKHHPGHVPAAAKAYIERALQ